MHSTNHQLEYEEGEQPIPVRRAVILAAGKGNRIQPLTAGIPKCLIEVGGQSLIERALHGLSSQHVSEAVIVVGYKASLIRDRVGASFEGIKITYVDAYDYETTNNIRSLWDARNYLTDDVILIEADVIFDSNLITDLLRERGSSAAVAPNHKALSGTLIHCDEQRHIIKFIMNEDLDRLPKDIDLFKTVNVYLFRKKLLEEQIVPRLEQEIRDGHENGYYESVLRDFVEEESKSELIAVDVSRNRWYEIDDHRDLDAAEFLFSTKNQQFDRIQELHGAYWRYGFIDHAYLYNMYFPPTEMLEVFGKNLPEIVSNYPVAQPELARLVANWTGANPDNLAVANGAAELIKILGNQFIQRLIIPTPSFNEYEEVVQPEKLERFPLDPDTFDLDIDGFAHAAVQWKADTAVIVTPNNPTALSVKPEELMKLAERLSSEGCRLIVDESFIEFSALGRNGSLEDLIDDQPNLAVIKSMSKVFGIAGLRLGYILSSDRKFINDIRGSLSIWNVNGMAEEFLHAAGRYRTEFIASCNQTRVDCIALYETLLSTEGIEPIEPDANFVLCKLSDPKASGLEVTRRLYVEHNILIKDCAKKSMPQADRYLRIASRTQAENRTLVDALASVL
ncbi:MAG TPA: aminotransferase class I/II-fold pyridoxal phosphate-dependent enzyme [Dehalococcoidia bacterium]|jgi:histidinol-phosphate/aromatic aminotransferase/cobyric acid decarboxylase-like protein/NDP-sugar pyrophosphorylase family protein|nr:aminotransferase class I/II-fold pyridoxal phosphate-dependent enzyme [Dehalococcoidia bacterium]